MSYTSKRTITSAEPTVFIEGQPAVIAGRATDNELPNEQPLTSGEPKVLIAGRPAATQDGQTSGKQHSLSAKPSVLIADQPAFSCAEHSEQSAE